MSNKLAIVGGTGAVGRVFIEYLKTHELPIDEIKIVASCLLYTSPSPRDKRQSRMPSSA